MSGPYDDMLHGRRPVSQKHPPMSLSLIHISEPTRH